MPFTHLHVHSEFSLLDGGSSSEKLVEQAVACNMHSLALTDHNTLTGAVRFVAACEAYGIKPILGVEITMEDESHLTLLAESAQGYSNLCGLITAAYNTGDRLTPRLPWGALEGRTAGVICLSGCRIGRVSHLVRSHKYSEAKAFALRLKELFGPDNLFIELQKDRTPGSARVARELVMLARSADLPVVATNNVHYATKVDSITHEVLRCVATKTTVSDHHPLRPLNGHLYLKSASEMALLFEECPEALANTERIAARCIHSLPKSDDVTPAYQVPPPHENAAAYLRHLAFKGAKARYGTVTPKIAYRLDYELQSIDHLGYNDYFLLVWGVVRWARTKAKIRATGRGSAADSLVAYALYLTDVDVLESDLPFERFLYEGKAPDIDIDFDSSRRDEVFEYIKQTYGEENVAMVCAYNTFRAKSAVRDVGKALALPEDLLTFLSKRLSHFVSAASIDRAFDRLAELQQYTYLRERLRLLFDLCARIADFPRHLQMHSSGVLISRVRLDTIAPLQPSAKGLMRLVQLDKDDAEAVGFIKFDALGLRIHGATTDATNYIRQYDPSFNYDRISLIDTATYDMFRAGGALGVFQFESAAQLNLALRLDIRTIRDLIAAVALIRPGPVKGDAVQRFLKARNGLVRVSYLHPLLEPILKRTYGVIIFQEQVVSVFAVMMGISEGEGDKFRKSLAKHARKGTLEMARTTFLERTLTRHPDFPLEHALALWSQLESWGGYGFTEGHAHAFALTGYNTAYLSRHHPAAYFAGLMSHQPMGYYSLNSLAAEVRRRGVRILPIDINESRDKCIAPDEETIRLGLRLVSGLRTDDVERIVAAQSERPFASLLDFCVRAPLHIDRLENLILCGAFDTLHSHRRGLVWRVKETMGLAAYFRSMGETQGRFAFDNPASVETPIAWDLPDFAPWDAFLWSWQITGLTAEAHVFAYLRDALPKSVLTTYEAARQKPGTRVVVAGINVQPHRPPTKSGEPILFTTLEDEFGLLQATVVGEPILTTTAVFLTAHTVFVQGVIVRSGRGVYLKVEKAKPLRMQDYVAGTPDASAAPPNRRTYTGTTLVPVS